MNKFMMCLAIMLALTVSASAVELDLNVGGAIDEAAGWTPVGSPNSLQGNHGNIAVDGVFTNGYDNSLKNLDITQTAGTITGGFLDTNSQSLTLRGSTTYDMQGGEINLQKSLKFKDNRNEARAIPIPNQYTFFTQSGGLIVVGNPAATADLSIGCAAVLSGGRLEVDPYNPEDKNKWKNTGSELNFTANADVEISGTWSCLVGSVTANLTVSDANNVNPSVNFDPSWSGVIEIGGWNTGADFLALLNEPNVTITVGGIAATAADFIVVESVGQINNGGDGWKAAKPVTPGSIRLVPEPATIALLGLGGLVLRRRKRS
jgi:hypothetical protein